MNFFVSLACSFLISFSPFPSFFFLSLPLLCLDVILNYQSLLIMIFIFIIFIQIDEKMASKCIKFKFKHCLNLSFICFFDLTSFSSYSDFLKSASTCIYLCQLTSFLTYSVIISSFSRLFIYLFIYRYFFIYFNSYSYTDKKYSEFFCIGYKGRKVSYFNKK